MTEEKIVEKHYYERNGGGLALAIGIIVFLLILLFAVGRYARYANRPQINVPSHVNVNVVRPAK